MDGGEGTKKGRAGQLFGKGPRVCHCSWKVLEDSVALELIVSLVFL